MASPHSPILLILDLDETLIHSTERPLDREPAIRVGPFFVYARPWLEEFLSRCGALFQTAVWSSAGADYAGAVVASIFPSETPQAFVWSREQCVQQYDPERGEIQFLKDLKKVKRKGFDLRRVLIVEDSPHKVRRSYGNAIYVKPFLGDPNDDELPLLSPYLATLSDIPDVRLIEKRGWRNRTRNGG